MLLMVCLIERQWQLIVSSLRGFILSVCACLLVGMTECTEMSLKDCRVSHSYFVSWSCCKTNLCHCLEFLCAILWCDCSHFVVILFCELLYSVFWWTRSKHCCCLSEYGHTQVTEPTRVSEPSISSILLNSWKTNFSHCW
jgi:hypothetical protein